MSNFDKLPKNAKDKVPMGKTLNELKNGTNSQRAKAILTAAIVALLGYFGVEPSTAEKIAPWIIRGFIVLGSLLFIFSVALFANSTFSTDQPDYSKEYSEVNQAAGRAARDNAIRYKDIPELIILGIAKAQTDVGKVSPYDSIERNSKRDNMIIDPPIGSTKNPGEGLGPYLISQDQLKKYPQVKPNYWSDSTNLVASWIQETINRLDQQGVSRPDIRDFNAQDEYWIKVIASLPLVDPLTQEEGCLVESDMPLPEMVKIIFECELEKNEIYLTVTETGPGGTLLTKTLSKQESIDTLTNEALNIIYVWGSRGKDLSWDSVEEQFCDNDQDLAGVFPISKSQANSFDLTDRCSAEDNIETALKIFIENYTKNKDNKNPYKANAAGWLAFGQALGPESEREKFLNSGKLKEYKPTSDCYQVTTNWLNGVLQTELGNTLVAYNVNGTQESYNASFESFTNESNTVRVNPKCVNTVNNQPPTVQEFLRYAEGIALAEISELYENAATDSNELASALAGLTNLSKNTKNELTPVEPKWGETSTIDRLSYSILNIKAPYVPTYFKPRENYRLGARAVAAAIQLGGYNNQDSRNGTDVLGDLLESIGEDQGSALFTGGFSLGIGIAIEREDPNDKKLIPQVKGSKLVKLKCGVDSSKPQYALPSVATRWESMCQDAKIDGVNLGINSAWRSMESQTALYNGQAPGEGRVATPGSSPHQKGQALDLVLGTSWGSGANEGAQYAWLHSIIGCIDPATYSFTGFDKPMLNTEYVKNLRNDNSPCNEDLMPVKRAQSYGFVFLCTHSPLTGSETWASAEAILCITRERMPESPTGQIREPWHIDIGPIVAQAIIGGGAYSRIPGCDNPPEINPGDKRSVAIAVKQVWYCELSKQGLANLPPRNGPGSYTGKKWFKNLADQVSSEAVLVAYCESSFNPSSGGGSYKGVFQMGPNEMKTFSKNPERWMDPEENIRAAVKYWSYGYRSGGENSGWRPWAVVNTQWYGEANPIQRPIIGRFKARPPSPSAGEATGLPLPNWAISPSEYWGIGGSCKESANNLTPLPDGKYLPLEGAWNIEAVAGAGSKAVLIVGDSLTVGSRTSLIKGLESSGWEVQVQAEQGDTILRAGGKIKKVSRIPRLVVSALGTNDWARSESEIVEYGEKFIKKVGQDRTVLWVNVFLDESKNPKYSNWESVNKGINRLASENSDKVRVFDWYKYVKDNNITTLQDGVHYSAEDYRKRADFIIQELNNLMSLPGFGDDRSAKQIELATKAISFALSEKGKPYVAGSRGPSAYDCSGFTYTAWFKAGFKWPFMPSYSQRTYSKVRKVPLGSEQPGDLVFTDYNHTGPPPRGLKGPQGVDHVAMVLDPVKGTTIEANLSGGVSIGRYHTNGKYVPQFISIGRPTP